MNKELENLFRDYAGKGPDRIVQLTSSGSHRTYYRLSSPDFSCIGVSGTDAEENDVFCSLSEHFLSKGIRVPKVYAVSRDRMSYIQQDLGDESLYDRLARGRVSGCYSDDDVALLKKTISRLPKIQVEGAEGWDFSRSLHGLSFSPRSIMFDLNYFKYCFLLTTGVGFNEDMLQEDFLRLSDELMKCMDDSFMYRDFQSRNVMIVDGEPYFIDFQGGRKGPLYYDVASFVWQARSDFPKDIKEGLVSVYMDSLRQYRDTDEGEFREKLGLFVFFRTLQVLGAYGFRGYYEKKRHFLESIPYAIGNLRDSILSAGRYCPYMAELFTRLTELPRFAKPSGIVGQADATGLKVRIFSFSYRKGIPEDVSGNGGGYVFDCRGMHNPGKYEQFRDKTGMDREVADFLEGRGEVTSFLANVFSLADSHVEKYISRGFTDLMFSFGCTGGQHRSVYCAEALAAHLSARYNIRITLVHREQGVEKEF